MSDDGESTRSGLPDRQRETRIGMWVGGLALGYLLAAFIVPALLPPNTIPELSGRANAFDYASKDGGWGGAGNEPHPEGERMFHDQAAHGGKFAWTELDLFSAFVYGFGDLNCHQKHERSWFVNGNQMPVCTRDIGIFAGLAVAGFLFSRRGVNRWTIRDSLLSVVPDDWVADFYLRDRRALLAFGVLFLFLVPVALDGGADGIRSRAAAIRHVRCPADFVHRWACTGAPAGQRPARDVRRRSRYRRQRYRVSFR